MASTATKLFADSHHQSFQDAHFNTAGNDIYSPTVNINFNVPELLSEPLGTDPSGRIVRAEGWSSIYQRISGFFRSAENRGALVHGELAAQGPGIANLIQVQYSVRNTSSQERPEDAAANALSAKDDTMSQSEDSLGQSQNNCSVSSISSIDSESTFHFGGATSAGIYTRSMLTASTAGLACWHPQPRKSVGEKGIVPGDVGIFNLTHGFKKIFNIWEDESLPEVARHQLPLREWTSYPDEFPEGHTIVSGTSSKAFRSPDENHITGFEFHCQSKHGAVLACTTSADLEELDEIEPLRDFLIQHAGTVYQHANSIRRIADEDSLYIVSGCIKSDSWALAAYKDPAEAPDDLLTLSRRKPNDKIPAVYDWIDRGTAEARFGSNAAARASGAYLGKDQCLFLQGFKLALSQGFRARLKAVRTPARHNQHVGLNNASQNAPSNSTDEGAAGDGSPGGIRFEREDSAVSGKMKDSNASQPDEIRIEDFPALSRAPAFHPCDGVTDWLLKMTGADCALSHDDDWRKHSHEIYPWSDDRYFNIITSRTIVARNGVTWLAPGIEHMPPRQSRPALPSPKFTSSLSSHYPDQWPHTMGYEANATPDPFVSHSDVGTLGLQAFPLLPPELVYHILSYLPYLTLARASCVSKAWRAEIAKADSDADLWCHFLENSKIWFGGESEDAFANYIYARRRRELMLKPRPEKALPLPHPYKILFKSRHLTRTRWVQNPEPKHLSFPAHGSSFVTCLILSHGRIISASDDHSINVYSASTGEQLLQLQGHEGGVWALAASKDTVVSGSTDRTVRIWDLNTGKCTHIFGGHTSTVRCLAIVKPEWVDVEDENGVVRKEKWPKRPLIVTGSRDHSLRVWTLPRPHEPEYRSYIPDDHDADPSEACDKDENPYHRLHLEGHEHLVRALAARGRNLVSGSYDSTVRIWDIITGEPKWVLRGHSQKVYSVVLDLGRNQACSGSMDGTVRVWDLWTGLCRHTLTGHSSLVGLLGLSPSHLVSAAADSTLRIWDPDTGELQHTLAAHTGAITCFQHDEFKVLSGSDGNLKMWNIRDGTVVRDLLTGIAGVPQVVFEGRWCVAASNRQDTRATVLDVWDFGTENDEDWVGEPPNGIYDDEDFEEDDDEEDEGAAKIKTFKPNPVASLYSSDSLPPITY